MIGKLKDFRILKISKTDMYIIIPLYIRIIKAEDLDANILHHIQEPYIVTQNNKIISFSKEFDHIYESQRMIELWNTNIAMDMGYIKSYKVNDIFRESSFIGVVKDNFLYSHLPYTLYRCKYWNFVDQNSIIKLYYIDVYRINNDENFKQYIGIACTYDPSLYNGEVIKTTSTYGFLANSEIHKPRIPKLETLKRLNLDPSTLSRLKEKYKL